MVVGGRVGGEAWWEEGHESARNGREQHVGFKNKRGPWPFPLRAEAIAIDSRLGLEDVPRGFEEKRAIRLGTYSGISIWKTDHQD